MDRRIVFAILGFIGLLLPMCFTMSHVAETDFPRPRRAPDTRKLYELFELPATHAPLPITTPSGHTRNGRSSVVSAFDTSLYRSVRRLPVRSIFAFRSPSAATSAARTIPAAIRP